MTRIPTFYSGQDHFHRLLNHITHMRISPSDKLLVWISDSVPRPTNEEVVGLGIEVQDDELSRWITST